MALFPRFRPELPAKVAKSATVGLTSRDQAASFRNCRSFRNPADLEIQKRPAWDQQDWRAHFDERAAIREHNGFMPRAEAEAAAIEDCIVEWLDQAHTTTPAGVCAHCGRDGQVETVLPHGTERAGHVWVHGRCWPAWYAGRKSDALAAFSAMGLPTGVTSKMKSNSNA